MVDEPEPLETYGRVCVPLTSSPPGWLQKERDMRIIPKYWVCDIQNCFVPFIKKEVPSCCGQVTEGGGRLLLNKDSEHLRSPEDGAGYWCPASVAQRALELC